MLTSSLRQLSVAALVLVSACAPSSVPMDDEEASDSEDKAFTSARATLITVDFDGELRAPWQSNTTKLIQTQLFYLVGQLNADDGVARLDRVVLRDVKRVSTNDGWMNVTYHASVPVGWGSKTSIPEGLELTLPRKIGPQSLKSFTTKYGPSCSDDPAHTTSDNYWYHFRPATEGCAFEEADAATAFADVEISESNTSAKYPEYDRVWSDGQLQVVAVFGKYDDYATDPSDAGIRAYDDFIEALSTGFASDFATKPASVDLRPGVSSTDVTFTGTVDGRSVSVTALLIDSPRVAPASFNARYAELTKKADLVFYNGHAGLGANVRALADKGRIDQGQYRIFFLNGCDTFAYLNDTLAKRVAAANPDDPSGTKYADVLTNVMPAYFHSMPDASLAIVSALADADHPKTYEAIFAEIDSKQVVVATGEEDNTFLPTAEQFDGLSIASVVGRGQAQRFETPVLPAGRYVVRTTENGASPGDVDLYVGFGYAPGVELFDRRPYLYGSNEVVTLDLSAPTKLHVMVRGYEEAPVSSNHYRLEIE